MARGQDAIALLGKRLPEIAAWHGMSTTKLRDILRFDRSAQIDVNGRLHFIEQLPQALPPAQGATVIASFFNGPLEQTFTLHSKPGAPRVVYLNFVGTTLVDTIWNRRAANFRGTGSPIAAQPFDLDGVPQAFNDAELRLIQGTWRRVAEDFAPFDVDVTTQLPSAADLTRVPRGDARDKFGTTALITRRTFETGCNCGGIAYLSAFDDFDNANKPALVFFDALLSDEKNIAEAVSHEVGHNLGLSHDGALGGVEYYAGHGVGPTGWAPIMGVGYFKDLVQWSNGGYLNANNGEDDFAVMAWTNLAYRDDDYGNTVATAVQFPAPPMQGAVLTIEGIVSDQSDVDVFRLPSAYGQMTFQVTPAALSPNLDVLVSLYAEDGTLLATANPPNELDAVLQFSLYVPQTVYLSVRGTGNSDPAGGYSAYGSIGQYTVRASAGGF